MNLIHLHFSQISLGNQVLNGLKRVELGITVNNPFGIVFSSISVSLSGSYRKFELWDALKSDQKRVLDRNSGQVGVSLGIRMKIYKFRELTDETKRQRFLPIVLENTVWCAKPDDLNDQDEFRFRLDYGTVSTVVWEDGGGDPASYPIDIHDHKKVDRETDLYFMSK